MKSNEFVKLVAQMREAQRNYFKTRNSAWLEKSKMLERQVDNQIKAMTDPQPDLFNVKQPDEISREDRRAEHSEEV